MKKKELIIVQDEVQNFSRKVSLKINYFNMCEKYNYKPNLQIITKNSETKLL